MLCCCALAFLDSSQKTQKAERHERKERESERERERRKVEDGEGPKKRTKEDQRGPRRPRARVMRADERSGLCPANSGCKIWALWAQTEEREDKIGAQSRERASEQKFTALTSAPKIEHCVVARHKTQKSQLWTASCWGQQKSPRGE